MKNLSAIFFLMITVLAQAGDPKFPVSSIPEDLKTGMYGVIREHEVRFEINSISSSTFYYHMVITILNANAKNQAKEVVGYDKLRTIKSFTGVVYDAMGVVIKKLKQSEIYDHSNFDGLFSDNRSKSADLTQGTYPYTVEYEYEVEQKYLYSLPDFFLYYDDEISIQKSSYTIAYLLD